MAPTASVAGPKPANRRVATEGQADSKKGKNIRMIFSFYPNLFSENSFTDFKSVNVRNYKNKNFDYYEIKDDRFSDLRISSVTALSYSQFQKNFPKYHFSEVPKFDAIFGIPFLLENSLTINFKQKKL